MKSPLVAVLLLLTVAACGAAPQSEPTAASAGESTVPPSVSPTDYPALPATPKSEDVHHAESAGTWYPADAGKLQAAVDGYLEQSQVEPIPGRLVGVIVPHAGYLYSGAVAGHAFRAMQAAGCSGHTIAVIGDTHTGSGSAQISVWASGAFETPLGAIPVDEMVAQALIAANPLFQFDRQAFQNEHPIENQLPFIQTACPRAQIVPVTIRQPSLQNAQILADALVRAIGDQPAFIVASTDLSHYHPYEQARRIDEIALQAIVSLDPQQVLDSPRRCAELGIAENTGTMCSMAAVMTALIAARAMGADRATVLHYANSGDVPIGDRSQVVGYGAVALWQASSQPAESTSSYTLPPMPTAAAQVLSLSSDTQAQLLELARRTAGQFARTDTFPPFHPQDPALLQPLGAFVTYREGNALRGCMGRLQGDRPVYLNVQYAAVMAAFADSRFPPVAPEELEKLNIEITLLHPVRQVMSPQDIRLGREGVLMNIGEEGSALFLPQVPLEEGWDLETTLVQLCRKAGLPDGSWQRPEARFYVFAGDWFGEQAIPADGR